MLYRQIDPDGYFVADTLSIPDGADPALYLDTAPAQGFYRPRWDGEQWVEGATPEEIPAPAPPEPTPVDRLDALEAGFLELILGGMF